MCLFATGNSREQNQVLIKDTGFEKKKKKQTNNSSNTHICHNHVYGWWKLACSRFENFTVEAQTRIFDGELKTESAVLTIICESTDTLPTSTVFPFYKVKYNCI